MLTALNQVKPKDWSLCAHLLFFFKMHFAARTHTQRSKGAVGPTVDYRPQGEALMAGAWGGPSDGYGPGKTKRLIFMCTSPVFFQNAAWHWMLEIISQGKQFRANWGQGCRWSLTIARNITATSCKKKGNYLQYIFSWKLFQIISQGKQFRATRTQTTLITGNPEQQTHSSAVFF